MKDSSLCLLCHRKICWIEKPVWERRGKEQQLLSLWLYIEIHRLQMILFLFASVMKELKYSAQAVLSRSSYGHLNAEWDWFCLFACFSKKEHKDENVTYKTCFLFKIFVLLYKFYNIHNAIKFTVKHPLVFLSLT